MTQDEFRKKILKVSEHRVHKINNSIGVYDIYKIIRKNKWFNIGRPLTEKEFYKIIRLTNTYLGEELLKGRDVELPCRMGKIELRRFSNLVNIVNGKLKVKYPIDWYKTLKLWHEDTEAMRDKTLVRIITKDCTRIYYNVYSANYNNKGFMCFKLNRELKKRINNRFKNGYLDAFKL